jgi:type IV secretory pathway VirD2 relaxase
MATVNAVNSKSKGGGGLRGSLRYISQEEKTLLDEKRKLASGVNCSPDTAHTEFMTTKRSFGKTGGRQFYHFVQSFSPDEVVTPEQVHRIGLEFAEKQFPGFEVVVATHIDTDHLHSHLIVNSVSYETGKKLHQSSEDLRQHRAV